jgi:eukaryotic-like serine/threonine-protein kinase
MICGGCGAANRGDARFCGACGAASALSSTQPDASLPLGEAAGPAMIGREIAGRYRMLAKLGEGGMGTVYRAEQISLKRAVAVKLLRPEVVGNQVLLRRFNAEAEAVAKLSHPNTVSIYDFGQDTDGTLFIAMEYIEGRSLRSVIQREAPLPPRRALAIALQVAASLADAHARAIVHRDLKPDNVMLQDRGRERDIARVLDFGIAKLRDDTRATQQQMTGQGDLLGTPQYMAPEQIRGEAIDGRTDIYALGCLLYEMVTGRLPHEAQTVLALLSKHLLEHPVPPSQRRPELGLPIGLDLLILGAMAKDPAARPPTMEAFGEHIAALLAVQPPDPHSAQRSAVGSAAVPAIPTPLAPSLASGAPAVPPAHTPAAYSVMPRSPVAQAPVPPLPPVMANPPSAAVSAGAPLQLAIPRPRGRKPAIIALAVIVALGAAITSIAVVRRAPGSSRPDDPTPSADRDDDDEPDEAPPPEDDPWGAPASPSSSPSQAPAAPAAIEGTKLSAGQGVSLIVPPGFQTTLQNGAIAATDARGVIIAAGPIDVGTNDPKQLARNYAKRTGLVLESMQTIYVGSVQCAMAIFRGSIRGMAVRQAVVPLIGPGYRVAVVFQAPAQLAKTDVSVTAQMFELFGKRVVLP